KHFSIVCALQEEVMGSHQGDQGDQGDQGNLGATGGTAAVAFPDRSDFPFIAVPHVDEQVMRRTRFGDRNWAANWHAWCAFGDFAQTDWRNLLADSVPPP